MAGKDLTEKTLEYIRALFRDNADGHGADHTLRVYRNAVQIAENEPGCDRELIVLAALLHDADDHKLFRTENNANARAFLAENGVPEDRADRICEVINAVSFSRNRGKVPETPEGKIVQDADRLDALGAIGIARTFAFGGSRGQTMYDPDIQPQPGKTAEEYRKNSNTTINHFYEKLLLLKDMMNTESARIMAEHRHRVMEDFLQAFYAEWQGEA